MPQRTIPVISSEPQLATWQAGLRNVLKRSVAPPVPANVTAVSKQGGNYLTWASVKGADGYQVDISENGDFSVLLTSVKLPGNSATAYFDAAPTSSGSAPRKRYYQVRATAGTIQQPQNVVGAPSSTIASSAIAPNDTVTASTSVRDTSNYDKLNTDSRAGGYRNPGNL